MLGTFVGHAVGAGKPEMAGVWTQVEKDYCLVIGDYLRTSTLIVIVLYDTEVTNQVQSVKAR